MHFISNIAQQNNDFLQRSFLVTIISLYEDKIKIDYCDDNSKCFLLQ